MKTRFDFIYNNRTPLNPNWFLQFPNNTIMTPSTEFHCNDRWKERVGRSADYFHSWPVTMTDQILMGDYVTMRKFFLMYKYMQMGGRKSCEHVLARYVNQRGIEVQTVELQVAQPGGKYILGNPSGWGWETSACKTCFLKNETYYWRHPERNQPPVRACMERPPRI